MSKRGSNSEPFAHENDALTAKPTAPQMFKTQSFLLLYPYLYQTEISSINICFDEEFKYEIRFWWREGENFYDDNTRKVYCHAQEIQKLIVVYKWHTVCEILRDVESTTNLQNKPLYKDFLFELFCSWLPVPILSRHLSLCRWPAWP